MELEWDWNGTGPSPAWPGPAEHSQTRPGPTWPGRPAWPSPARPARPDSAWPGRPARHRQAGLVLAWPLGLAPPAKLPGQARPARPGLANLGLSWHGRSASPRPAKLPGQARPARPGLANPGLSWHARSASPRPAKRVGLGWTSLSWSRRSKACARSRYYTTTRRTRCEACKATPNILNPRSGVCEINAHPHSIEARMQPRSPHFNVVSLSSWRVVARAK